jgi:hypothetical protein
LKLKNPFKETEPLRQPVILTIEQLEAVLAAHDFAGSYVLKGVRSTICGCGNRITGDFKELRRHQAEQIALLQK